MVRKECACAGCRNREPHFTLCEVTQHQEPFVTSLLAARSGNDEFFKLKRDSSGPAEDLRLLGPR